MQDIWRRSGVRPYWLTFTCPPFLRKGKLQSFKVELFFNKEITWIAWMELYSPLKVWAGSRVGFQCHPLSILRHNPVTVHRLTSAWTCAQALLAVYKPVAPSMKTHNTTPLWETSTACPHLFQRSIQISWALLWSKDMAQVYGLWVGIITGKICCYFISLAWFCDCLTIL